MGDKLPRTRPAAGYPAAHLLARFASHAAISMIKSQPVSPAITPTTATRTKRGITTGAGSRRVNSAGLLRAKACAMTDACVQPSSGFGEPWPLSCALCAMNWASHASRRIGTADSRGVGEVDPQPVLLSRSILAVIVATVDLGWA